MEVNKKASAKKKWWNLNSELRYDLGFLIVVSIILLALIFLFKIK